MPTSPGRTSSAHISSDTWAVLLSVGLALLVRFGVLKIVPW
jgi:hypothetical protein